MTRQEKYINNMADRFERLKRKLVKLADKAKQKKQSEKLKYLREINKVRGKFRTANNRLQRLREADILQWEKRRLKVRDSLWEIRGAVDRLAVKIK